MFSCYAPLSLLDLEMLPRRFAEVLQKRVSTVATPKKANLTFVNRDGSRTSVQAAFGKSILEVAHENNVELEGACEGSMACSTCHVILESRVFDSLENPCEREEDLLDLAPGLTDTSRLSCQVRIDERVEGAEIRLPRVTVNFYVDGHVPKPH
jgi:ferredoxin